MALAGSPDPRCPAETRTEEVEQPSDGRERTAHCGQEGGGAKLGLLGKHGFTALRDTTSHPRPSTDSVGAGELTVCGTRQCSVVQ